ncbi:MAG: glycosyltransferase family 1 protein [Alteraurantiacibacter sp.]
MTRVLLDISRLISRVRHSTPSGVDRVEMAYARGFLNAYGDQVDFGAVHPSGVYGRIGRKSALSYLDELDLRWSTTSDRIGQRSLAQVSNWVARLRPKGVGVGSADVLVQVSPHHLHKPEKVARKLERERARFICMVHDLIPIEYPEYARPGGAALHARRMATVANLADAVIANSAATGASLARWIESQGKTPPPIQVAHLGTETIADFDAPAENPNSPYFVCLGTIEPRKNHLLLLHIWRSMAQTMPASEVPRLVIIGRRGWENEQVLDLLERSPSLHPFVKEVNSCGDSELARYLRGATALLMPSFAEGYGMPVAEALSVGTPVIASDIGAHREVGADVPDYFDPLDGKGWRDAVLDHARGNSPHREQLARMQRWKAPDWAQHIDIVTDLIERQMR